VLNSGFLSLHARVIAVGLLTLTALAAWPRAVQATTTIPGGNVGNQTWAAADGPFVIQGDITVQSGATLTIQSGTVVRFASTDMQSAGTPRVEVIVNGTLAVNGTDGAPVTFEAETGTAAGTWQGITITAAASAARISDAIIRHAVNAVSSSITTTPLVVERSTIESNSGVGILVQAGVARFDALLIRNNPGAPGIHLEAGAGAFTLINSILTGNGNGFEALFPTTTVLREIVNSTIDRNSGAGIAVLSGGGIGAPGTLTVENVIVTNNGNGIARAQSSVVVDVTYSDVWNNTGSNYSGGIGPGLGGLSANPQYVSASDWHLQPSSVCIDSGGVTTATAHDLELVTRPQDGDGIADSDGSEYDMGAYELVRSSGAGGSTGSGGSGAGGAGTGTGGAVGTGGGSASGGATGADAAVDAAASGGGGGGCGCRTGGAGPSSGAAGLLLGVALLTRRQRRQSRRSAKDRGQEGVQGR
jgi:MYXO-CTERM domain-containing protein